LLAAGATAAIAVVATLGAAAGEASASCLPPGAKLIAEGSAGVVYAGDHAVYACSAGTGRRTRLGASGIAGPGATVVGPFAVAGSYVAYGTHTGGVDSASSEVFLRRLSTGRVISRASPFPTVLGPESSTAIESVVASPSGAYAWIVSGESIIHAHSFDIGVYEATPQSHLARLLDRGPQIAPKSLTLHGRRLRWRHGSETRHATLG